MSWRIVMRSRRLSGARCGRRRDPVLHSVLRRNAEQVSLQLPQGDDVVAEMRRILVRHLQLGDVGIRTAARSMAFSVRSLQRHLAAAGTTYYEIVDSIRREAADQCLSDRALSTSEIAYLLGYSNPPPSTGHSNAGMEALLMNTGFAEAYSSNDC